MKEIISLLLCVFVTSCLGAESQFKQAIEPRTLQFPQDHASHPGFQTEWWYFTGNLKDDGGREFGYQFTIFRRAVSAQAASERGRTSAWAVDDIYIGHLAISDIGGKTFHFQEEARRGMLDVAGATNSPHPRPLPASQGGENGVRVWMGSWEMLRTEKGFLLKAESKDMALQLELSETVAPVCHGRPGEEGLSRKGPRPGQASYYYSIPQLKTTGSLALNGKSFAIKSGVSWMDHEFGSNQLSAEQAGWDWFSIQLDDGSALMLYMLRNKDGSLEPNSSGTWIDASGKATYLPLGAIKLTRGRKWRSDFSGGEYTLGWQIELPAQKISLSADAAQDDQEVRAAKTSRVSYYEGAVRVSGSVGEKKVRGSGYLEITGAPGQKASGDLGGML
jgi:predicted secreted hydrolase